MKKVVHKNNKKIKFLNFCISPSKMFFVAPNTKKNWKDYIIKTSKKPSNISEKIDIIVY